MQGPNDPVPEYTYETSEPTLFRVTADGYVAVVNSQIDYENPDMRRFSMQITVKEKLNPSESATAVLAVVIMDINDNSPVFEQSSYSSSVDPGTGSKSVATVGRSKSK